MVVGVVLVVAGAALFVRSAGASVIETFTAPIRVTPVDVTLDLDEGTYVIYEATARGQGLGPPPGSGVTISPSDVTVLDSSGAQVTVGDPRFDETIDRDNLTFTGAARFTVDDSGPHRLQVAGSGQQILVAPSLIGSFGQAVAWAGMIGLGLFVGLFGLVLLIIGLIRGSRSGPSQPAVPTATLAQPIAQAAPTPVVAAPTVQPGWYDDPHGVARLRWWDGQQWTEYTS